MTQLRLAGVEGTVPEPLFAWPGSKRRLRHRVLARLGDPWARDKEKGALVSPFIGGGAVELAAAAAGWLVIASDLNQDLVRLWQLLKNEPDRVADHMRGMAGKPRATMEGFIDLLDSKAGNDAWADQRAISLFYRLRSCLYHTPQSKTLEVNGRTGKEQWRANIGAAWQRRVREFCAPMLSVDAMGFDTALRACPWGAVYCDPPYVETRKVDYNKLYNNHSVDHGLLARLLLARDTRWVLSINDCEWARDTFEGQPGVEVEELRLTWRLGTRDGSKARKMGELLVFRV